MTKNGKLNIDALTDFRTGRQHRSIYTDAEIYEIEQERIFGRCWLFLAHERQIQNPGDFMRTFMGEDEVLVVRQKNGSVKEKSTLFSLSLVIRFKLIL